MSGPKENRSNFQKESYQTKRQRKEASMIQNKDTLSFKVKERRLSDAV